MDKTAYLGKAVRFTVASNNPIEYTTFTDGLNVPLSLMMNLRFNSVSSTTAIFALLTFGVDTTTGAGWALYQTGTGSTKLQIDFGASSFVLTFPLAFVVGVDYTLVITFLGTTATGYVRRKDNDSAGVQTATVTIGSSISAASKNLVLGSLYQNAAFSSTFDGWMGAFALWDRALSTSEAYSLVDNPYQLWLQPGGLAKTAAAAAALAANATAHRQRHGRT
jgi:hypothetical protein